MRKLGFYLCLLLWMFSCTANQKPTEDGPLKIVTTTGMIADMVKNISGELAQVEALMGPGVDPHLYKATHGDLTKLRAASIIFYNGLHLEGKMGEVFEKIERLPGKTVVAIGEEIDKNKLLLVDPQGPTYDPHIWFDVALWTETLPVIERTLLKALPEYEELLKARTLELEQQLRALDLWVSQSISVIPETQRTLITAHDAFGYFGRAYNIDVKGLQGISTLSEAGLKDVTSLVKLIVDNNIKAVFVESSVSEKAINSVVEGAGDKGHKIGIGGTLFSDAMGEAGTPEGTYNGMVRHNVSTIVNGLK